MAMRIIVRMAEVYAASELLDTTTTHIDNTIFMGDATLEYAERPADLGATVAVPATSNVSGVTNTAGANGRWRQTGPPKRRQSDLRTDPLSPCTSANRFVAARRPPAP